MQFFLTHYLINSIILFYFQFEWMSWVNELIKLRKMNEIQRMLLSSVTFLIQPAMSV
jgi:hypothetical protein